MKHYTRSNAPELMRLRRKYLPCKVQSLTDLLWLTNKVLGGTVVVSDLVRLNKADLLAVAIEVCGRMVATCKDIRDDVQEPRRETEGLARNVAQYLKMIPPGMAWIAMRDAAGGKENPTNMQWWIRFVTRNHRWADWEPLYINIRANANPQGFKGELRQSKARAQETGYTR